MFATLITVALLISPAIQGVVADFTMPTPKLTQCQDAHVTWDQTKGPYNIIVVPSADPCGDALADLGTHNGPAMTWTVTLPAGKKVALTVEDADGEEAWTGDVVVAPGKDDSCLSPADLASVNKSKSATTLSVPASAALPTAASNTTGAGNTQGAGAINNAGSNPLSSGAFTVPQVSAPVLAMSAFIGAVTLIL